MKTKFTTLTCLIVGISLGLSACGKSPESISVDNTSQSLASATMSSAVPPLSDYLSRDVKDDIFYFVMPDRFHNATPDNDQGDPIRMISQGGLDKTSKWAFHGGDINGIEAKLDYIQGLGISAIWMTPLLRNLAIQQDGFGHHGYWVIDFTEIDPHFGTNEDLKSLIAAAHRRNIKVFFDIITNHTADVIKYRECHQADGTYLNESEKGCKYKSAAELASGDTYTPFVMDGEENIKTPMWLNDPKYYNNQGDSFWEGESAIYGDFAGLDDINTRDPFVVQGMIEIFQNIINEFKPDGFRIDTVKHVDLSFWQAFGPAIIEHAQQEGIPKFHIFGEVYDGNPAGLSKYTTAGKLPSVLDFGFHFNVKDALYYGKDINRINNLFDNDDYYRDADSGPELLMNFLGNHDAGRTGYFIQQGMPNESAQTHLQRSILSHAFMYASRGIPVVYYGDEQGFSGDGGDVDARENMDMSQVDVYNDNVLVGTNKTTADDNFDTTHPIYQALAQLSSVRQAHKALSHGIHQNRLVDNATRTLAFSRVDFVEQVEYLVLTNLGSSAQGISLGVDSPQYDIVYQYPIDDVTDEMFTVNDGQLSAELAPLSIVIAKASHNAKIAQIEEVVLGDPYLENSRLFIPADVTFTDNAKLNLASASFYIIDDNGTETLLATDTTSPYRAIVMPDALKNAKELRVIVSNLTGKGVEASITL